MDDDFNTGAAVSELFELLRVLNKFVDSNQLEDAGKGKMELVARFQRGVLVLRELTATLGLFRAPAAKQSKGNEELIGNLVNLFLELRQDARAKKDFATGDKIRQSLGEMGVILEDRKGVTEWRLA
jgi:cysteinyl-tRNA synthetase